MSLLSKAPPPGQAAFVHIADELIAVAAHINSRRDASTSAAGSCSPSTPRLAMQVADVLKSPHGGGGARIAWYAERLQCVWQHVQRYHIQLNGKYPDMDELVRELGRYPGGLGRYDTAYHTDTEQDTVFEDMGIPICSNDMAMSFSIDLPVLSYHADFR